MRLNKEEQTILKILNEHPRQAIPADTIATHLWGASGKKERKQLSARISKLRHKIAPNGAGVINSLPRYGYRWDPNKNINSGA